MKALLATVVVLCGLFIGVNAVFSQGLTFATNAYAVGMQPAYVAVADVNGDGKMDVIVGYSFSPFLAEGILTVLTNNGSGGFGSIDVELPGTHSQEAIAVADINGDGKPDLITGVNSVGSGPRGTGVAVLTVVTNNGGSNFVAQNITYSNPGAPTGVHGNISWVLATNINSNGNGKPDLIIANYTVPGYLTVLTNAGGTNFFSVQTNYIVGYQPTCVVAADVNGKGYPDLICANLGGNTLTLLTNDGTGVFGSNATLSVGGSPNFITAADVNGDGFVDLISANTSSPTNQFGNTLTILTNDGSGVYGSNATIVTVIGPAGIVAADINGDGYADLINANYYDNTLTMFTNNGSGVFGSNAALNVGNGPWGIAAADLNGDGKLDLATADFFGGTVSVLIQTNFSPPMLNITSSSSNSVVVSWPLPGYEPMPGFTLQTNSDPATANWAIPGYVVSTNGQVESVTINPLPPANLFFRLKSQ